MTRRWPLIAIILAFAVFLGLGWPIWRGVDVCLEQHPAQCPDAIGGK